MNTGLDDLLRQNETVDLFHSGAIAGVWTTRPWEFLPVMALLAFGTAIVTASTTWRRWQIKPDHPYRCIAAKNATNGQENATGGITAEGSCQRDLLTKLEEI